jgi:hypothetical protein
VAARTASIEAPTGSAAALALEEDSMHRISFVRTALRRTALHPSVRPSRPHRSLLLEGLEARLCLSTIAYWRFEEGRPNVAASGINTILDSSGDDLDGTPFGGPVYRSSTADNPVPLTGDPNSLSLDFNGSNQRIFIPDDRLFRLTHSLTLEAYINLRAFRNNGSSQDIIFRGDDRIGLDPYRLDVVDNLLRFQVTNANNEMAPVTAPLPGINQWIHVAGTLDDATGVIAVYINGRLAASKATNIRPFAFLDPTEAPGLGIRLLETTLIYGSARRSMHAATDRSA